VRKTNRKENRREWTDKEKIDDGDNVNKNTCNNKYKIILNTGKLKAT